MIKGLLYADLSNFFNRVPTGRIVNRLTKDLSELDFKVMDALSFLLVNFFDLLGTLVICAVAGTPLALIPMALSIALSIFLRKYYMKT